MAVFLRFFPEVEKVAVLEGVNWLIAILLIFSDNVLQVDAAVVVEGGGGASEVLGGSWEVQEGIMILDVVGYESVLEVIFGLSSLGGGWLFLGSDLFGLFYEVKRVSHVLHGPIDY